MLRGHDWGIILVFPDQTYIELGPGENAPHMQVMADNI
jgi:hypothetical protein